MAKNFVVGAVVAMACVALSAAPQFPLHPTSTPSRHVLIPVAGTWTADYENGRQILTADGLAPAKAPDVEAVTTLFGEQGPALVTALIAPGTNPIAVVRDIKETGGGLMSVQFRLDGGKSDQTAGIFFGLKPNGGYVYVRYNAKDGNLSIWRFQNGARTRLQQGVIREQLPLHEWQTLSVTAAGTSVTASVNGGRLRVGYVLAEPVSGRVGVWAEPDSVTTYKGFTAIQHHVIHR